MASGGTNAFLAAAILTSVYTNGSSSPATVNISFCNQSSATTTIRVAISKGTTNSAVTAADYIEYNRTITGSGVYQRTGCVLGPGESIYAFDLNGVCSVRVEGFEGNS